MRSIFASLGLALVAWVCSSCGTQVYLNKWEPSQVALPRGTVLHVRAEARGPLRYELRRAFEQQIAADSYYRLHGDAGCADIRLHRVEVEMRQPAEDDKYHKRPYPVRVNLTADVISNYQRIYRRECSQYVGFRRAGHADWEAVAEDVASAVMRDLTPHQELYAERVDEVETNPSVELAARACAAGNWTGGREYAAAALEQNPQEAEAYYVLGLIERNARQYAESDACFRKAYSLKPERKYAAGVADNARLKADEELAQQQLRGR